MTHRLGRKSPLWKPRNMRAAHRLDAVLASLGPPPGTSADFVSAVSAKVGNNFGMMGNDAVGDCTCADPAHALMIRSANTGALIEPATADALALYTAITGYDPAQTDANGDNPTDQGANIADVCRYLTVAGFMGHKATSFAPVATGMVDDAACDRIKWAIQLFGSCQLGVNLPASAMSQFDAGQPWSIAGDLTIEGGHDVPGVKYDPTYLYVITWAGLQPVEWAWLKRFGEEAWGIFWPDFLLATGLTPDGFSQDALVNGLATLAA